MTDPLNRPFTREPFTAEGVVNDNRINIRTLPFTQNSASLGKFDRGDTVSITATVMTEADPPNWYEISYQNKTAYIAANFVTKRTSTPVTPAEGDVLLPVRWFSQVDSRHFEACGPTSVLMLLNSYKRGMANSLDDLSEFITITQVTGQRALIAAAKAAGPLNLIASSVTPENVVDTLTSYLAQRKPVILLIDYVKLREAPFHPPRYLKRGVRSVNHWWIVVGVQGDNFVINDPLWLSRDNDARGGENLLISKADLKHACANFILVPDEALP